LDDFNAQGLSNSLWALAKLGHKDKGFIEAWIQKAKICLDAFNEQDLSNSLWALAELGHKDKGFIEAWIQKAKICLDDFTNQGLLNSLSALKLFEIKENIEPIIEKVKAIDYKSVDSHTAKIILSCNQYYKFLTPEHKDQLMPRIMKAESASDKAIVNNPFSQIDELQPAIIRDSDDRGGREYDVYRLKNRDKTAFIFDGYGDGFGDGLELFLIGLNVVRVYKKNEEWHLAIDYQNKFQKKHLNIGPIIDKLKSVLSLKSDVECNKISEKFTFPEYQTIPKIDGFFNGGVGHAIDQNLPIDTSNNILNNDLLIKNNGLFNDESLT
jgi:hypothetical protein